ncbi:MAG: ABC transporter substrate-binding protein [Holosporaceae bacterium]|jgi:putative ABC transport system substrate-binding protein|nr:ABC transporter substrate-binding protein [Holosporaceae bacterium]
MKKIALLLLGISLTVLASSFFSEKKENTIQIGVCQAVEHEALNSVVRGLKDFLGGCGGNYAFVEQTCQGNMALASQIVSRFVAAGVVLVATVGTTPSQCAFRFAKGGKTSLIFGSVTNPADISANLADCNTTGVSNFVELDPQIKMFKKIQPTLKNIGIIYNTGEANSAFILKKMRETCRRNDIALLEKGISKLSEISQVAAQLSRTADAIFISNDNLALSSISKVIDVCNKSKIPVYVSDTDQVEKGCLAALGPNQYDIGVQMGKMVARVAAGENINKIAIEYPQSCELFINLKAAKKLGMTIPSEILLQAKTVIGE